MIPLTKTGMYRKLTRSPGPSVVSATHGASITVFVGTYAKPYSLHEALVTHNSGFFKGALRGDWVEATERTVTLAEVEPTTFNLFVHWLYNRRFPEFQHVDTWQGLLDTHDIWAAPSKRNQEIEDDQDAAPEVYHDICMALVEAHDLGDRFLAAEFRTAVHDCLVLCIMANRAFHEDLCSIIALAFEVIPADRPVLQLLVERFCSDELIVSKDVEIVAEAEELLPRSFLLRTTKRRTSGNNHPQGGRCFFEHTPEEREQCRFCHVKYDKRLKYASWA